jgi:apolipoprotein N-acyltransferase
LIFSLFFGLIEFIRGSILTGFPWNLISFSFSNSIYFIQIISIIGTYSFNLICITLFTLPAVFVLKKSKKNIVFVSGFILVTVSFVIFGIYQIKEFNVLPSLKKTYSIKAISSNISLDRFYIEKNEKEIINELIDLSAPEKDKPTIFIWPEGIITESDLEDIHVYKDLFINNFSEDDLIVLGLNSSKVVNNKNLIFNSMAIFNNRLELIHKYDKVNLVPFGEFVPFENILSKIGFKTITNSYQSYSSGKVRKPVNLKNDKIDVNLLPLICYEIIYSGKLSKEKNYDYIINISEDGWFGSSIGPKQHFAHSIFRSIESGKYIIRSANNGISAIINPIGIVEKKIEFKKNGNIELIESKKLKSTIFMIYGNLIFLALILLYIFLIFSFNKLTNE